MISDNILLWKLEKGSSSADEEQEQSNRWSDGKAKPRRGRAKKTAKSEEDGGVNDSESLFPFLKMGTPWTPEDQLVKRSLIGSIFGVANRLRSAPRSTASSEHSGNPEGQQPCCSSQLYQPFFPHQPVPQPSTSFVQPPTCQFHSEQPYRVPTVSANVHQPQHQPSSFTPSPFGDQPSPTTALGQQLDRQLDLGNLFPLDNQQPQQQATNQHHHHPIGAAATFDGGKCTEEIYREIVRECRALEQRQTGTNQGDDIAREESELISAAIDALPAVLERQTAALSAAAAMGGCVPPHAGTVPLPVQASMEAVNSPQSIRQHPQQQLLALSLEHLVKIVVATVREVTGGRVTAEKEATAAAGQKRRATVDDAELGAVDEGGGAGEQSAEVILERRRQQNNAAAARYRRRRRQVESGLHVELDQLERRNWRLREEMAKLQVEIDAANVRLRELRKPARPNDASINL